MEKLAETEQAKSTLTIERTKGIRKVTTGFMHLAKSFQEFLKVYCGVVDIMVSPKRPRSLVTGG